MDINSAEWIRCPVCGSKTRDKMRKDTILKNFPLFCPKCKHENLINVCRKIIMGKQSKTLPFEL